MDESQDTPDTQDPGDGRELDRHPHVVDFAQRLSRSLIWQWQRAYYEHLGVNVWREGLVPQYITTNPFIAETYVRLAIAYLEDCGLTHAGTGAAARLGEPIYIVELGAGSGRFAHAFLKKLRAAGRYVSLPPIRYVMTDLAQRNVAHWIEHPSLRPFVDEGVLDFARYDPCQDDRIDFAVSRQSLVAGGLDSPLIVVANYFFDGIRHDAFRMIDGQLLEGNVTVTSPQEEPDLGDPQIIERMELEFQYQSTSADRYYEDEAFNAILRQYQREVSSSTLAFPIAALECCRELMRLGSGGMLLLTGDRGYVGAEALADRDSLGLARHGSFSMDVNFDALSRYFTSLGGNSLVAPRSLDSLHVSAFTTANSPAVLPRLQQSYAESVTTFGPGDFFPLKELIEDSRRSLTIEEGLAWVRLGGDDPELLRLCAAALLDRAESATPMESRAVRDAVERAWNLYYPLGEKTEMAYTFGSILCAYGYCTEALAYFVESENTYGPSERTQAAIARCHKHLREAPGTAPG